MNYLLVCLVPFMLLYWVSFSKDGPWGVYLGLDIGSIPLAAILIPSSALWYWYGISFLLTPFNYSFFETPWSVVALFILSLLWLYANLFMLAVIIGAAWRYFPRKIKYWFS